MFFIMLYPKNLRENFWGLKKQEKERKEIDMPLCKQCILFTLLTPWIMEGNRFLPWLLVNAKQNVYSVSISVYDFQKALGGSWTLLLIYFFPPFLSNCVSFKS